MSARPSQPASEKRSRLQRWLRPTWEERKRLLPVEAWIFTVASYVVIGFAYLFPHDFRNASAAYVAAAWLAFLCRTLLFHLGLVLVAIAAVAAWRRSWRLALFAAPLLLVTVGPALWSYRPKSPASTQGETVTLMSVNLLMVNKDTGPIIEEIARNAPDILLLQEYTDHWHQALQQTFGATYPHIVYVTRWDSFGTAIYSRRPFVGAVDKSVPLGDATEPQIRAVIKISDQDVALYNVHLLPPRRLDYTTMTRLQFADLIDQLNNEKLPVIVAGDLNFTECSPQADALSSAGLHDAHTIRGMGRGATWPVIGYFRWLPGLRLDHIYLSSEFTCVESRTGTGQGSDHRPIIVKIGFREGASN